MAKFIMLFFLISAFFTLSTSHDYMILSLTWPNTFCQNKHCSRPITQNFTIHGIWDAYSGRPIRPSPSPVTFNQTQLLHLERRLNMSWPNLLNTNDNPGFWKHEWEVHGRFLKPSFTLVEYFELGLNWKDRIDVLRILEDQGLGPDPAKARNATLIRSAIRAKTTVAPVLKCSFHTPRRSLARVELCIDKLGTQLIACPKLSEDDCGPINIAFP